MGYNQTHIPNVKTLAGGDEYIGFKDNLGNLIGVVGHENDTLVIRGTSDVDTPDKPVVIEGLTVSSGGILGGFMDYNDTATSTTPITLVADTWATIPNDGLGAFSNDSYKPDGNVVELMDTSVGAIDPTGLNLGDVILVRNDFTVTPNTNNASLEFRYSLGTGAGSYTLQKRLGRLDEGSGIGYRFSLTPDLIYMGDLNTRDNPISLQVKLSSSGSLINAGTVITVGRYK